MSPPRSASLPRKLPCSTPSLENMPLVDAEYGSVPTSPKDPFADPSTGREADWVNIEPPEPTHPPTGHLLRSSDEETSSHSSSISNPWRDQEDDEVDSYSFVPPASISQSKLLNENTEYFRPTRDRNDSNLEPEDVSVRAKSVKKGCILDAFRGEPMENEYVADSQCCKCGGIGYQIIGKTSVKLCECTQVKYQNEAKGWQLRMKGMKWLKSKFT
jgi:hypothetical protein